MRSRNEAVLLIAILLTTAAAGLSGCGGNPGDAMTQRPAAVPSAGGMSVEQAVAGIRAAPAPAEVDAALWDKLTAELARVLSARKASQIVEHPPQGEYNRITDLQLVQQWEGGWRLQWSYVNVGDHDLNGLVSISDLTPIGRHFGVTSDDPSWEEARFADGDGDGMVTISDVTPIGQNYLSMVHGYRIYGANDADAPQEQWEASWQAWLDAYEGPGDFYPEVGFSELEREPSPRFSHSVSQLNYVYYKVAPFHGDSDSPPGQESHYTDWLTGGGPWHMFGHDRQHTCRSPYVGAQTSDIKWSYTMQTSRSSPAIGSDGTVYVGGYSPSRGLYAISHGGTFKWLFPTVDGVNSSPAIGADGTVYFGSGSHESKVYAVNPDGTLKWAYTTGDEVLSSPAVAVDGTVYVGCDDFSLYAINPDGTGKWAFPTGGEVTSSPAVAVDGTVYAGSWDAKLYALNPDGTLKWSYLTGGPIRSSPAVGADGTVYFGGGYNDDKIYALNPDGTLKWTYLTGGSIQSCPAIAADGTVYVGGGLWDYEFYALNPDGTLKWTFTTGGEKESSPAIGADGTVYVASHLGEPGFAEGMIYALNPDGSVKWSYATSNALYSSPAIAADGTVYVGTTDNKLYAFGPGPDDWI